MALAPGLVAVLRIVPLGDKVARGDGVEGAVRQLDPPPTGSLVEEMLEESLRGGHPAGPVRSGGCSSQSLAAWPSRQPGAWCSSSSLTPPQDRENCHASGNAFVLFDGFKPAALCNICLQRAMKSPSPSRRGRPKVYGWVPPLQEVLECVKFPPWGRVSAPAGVAPEAL